MTYFKAVLGVAAVTVLSAHVAPSVNDNNRYLKVTPLGDGLRLAYTVFYGEIPGASERRKIDSNRDSRIDDSEAKRFADKLGAEVAAALNVEIDGVATPVRWSMVSPGMGTDAVAAGAFSIDLVAFVCAPGTTGPSHRHRVRLRDAFRIPKPGETEVRVEDSPGVTIHRARVGAADARELKFVGPGGPLSDEGLDLDYAVSDKTPRAPDGACKRAGSAAKSSSATWWPLVGGAAVLAGGVGMWAARRRRARAS